MLAGVAHVQDGSWGVVVGVGIHCSGVMAWDGMLAVAAHSDAGVVVRGVVVVIVVRVCVGWGVGGAVDAAAAVVAGAASAGAGSAFDVDACEVIERVSHSAVVSASPLYLAMYAPVLADCMRYRPMPALGIWDGATPVFMGFLLGFGFALRFLVLAFGVGVVVEEVRAAAASAVARAAAVVLRVRYLGAGFVGGLIGGVGAEGCAEVSVFVVFVDCGFGGGAGDVKRV